ncbi:hypothetical protein BGZ61DRAFT_161981 [Ilyonectria robusta]|uniref:uncharacterized protein n=1 Tax=Ilyonectria robusta TaxID=1079257 RepID=UPI001E8CC8C7|nr:uncharacterized protein BGZ61DRAFT_161981 [Ilyonectria robusta]KAH8733537.1 hypothetical protein BGZ61DRAFT_161981 [Ilyonectria robusta]
MRVNTRNHAHLVATECDISCPPSQSITETPSATASRVLGLVLVLSPDVTVVPMGIPACRWPNAGTKLCRQTIDCHNPAPRPVWAFYQSPGQSHHLLFHLLFHLIPTLAIQFVRAIPMSISRLTTPYVQSSPHRFAPNSQGQSTHGLLEVAKKPRPLLPSRSVLFCSVSLHTPQTHLRAR